MARWTIIVLGLCLFNGHGLCLDSEVSARRLRVHLIHFET